MTLPRLNSLRSKLLLLSLVLVMVPGVLLSLGLFVSARRALSHATGRQLAEIARDVAEELAQTLSEERKDVRLWARQEALRDVARGDADGRVARLLTSLDNSDGRYAALLSADATGRVVAASDPALVGRDYSSRKWFRNAMEGRNTLRGPRFSSAYGRRVIEIAAPIVDPDQPSKVIGGLLGVYDWQHAIDLMRHIQQNLAPLGLPMDLAILDAHGAVIGGVWMNEPGLSSRNLRADGWIAAQPPPLPTKRNYVVDTRADVLVGVAHFESVRPSWTALAIQPLDEALEPVTRMWQRLLLALLGVLGAGLAVAGVLAERMSRPLRELTRATQRVTLAGAATSPVAVRSRDEIGELAASFNAMAANLARARDDLMVASRYAFLGEVAAGVAHEVRTPLGIMRSAAQLLARTLPVERPESRELVETIVDEVDRLDGVVAGLLQLARPHATVAEATSLPAVLSRALDFVSAQARERDITLRRELDQPSPAAFCDPEDLYQVALNLIVNALQILKPGGTITVRVIPPHDGRVGFEVCDDGPGIAEADRERIFTPFYTTREGGTGLGLALVQRFVQANKGTIAVNGFPEKGANFRIELPTAGRPE